MIGLLDNINNIFKQIPDTVRKYSWPVLGGFLVVTVVMFLGAGKMKMDASLDSFFEETEPVKLAYDRFRAMFGSDEAVYVVYEANDGDVFSDQSLKALRELQNDLIDSMFQGQGDADDSSVSPPLGHITDVKTLMNVKFLETRDNALLSRDFIGERLPMNEAEREQLRQLALAQADYVQVYFSKDFKYGGFMIKTDHSAIVIKDTAMSSDSLDADETLSLDDESASLDAKELSFEVNTVQELEAEELPEFKKTGMDEYAVFMTALNEVLNKEQYTRAFTFYPIGNPVQTAFAYKAMTGEAGMVMMGVLGLILAMLWGSFRSFSGVVWPVLIVILTLFWTFGAVGWSGLPMTSMIEIIMFLVLAVGVADAVHIISGYIFYRRQNQEHAEALRLVYQKSGLACFLTSLTTAVGLISLIFVPLVPIKNFAIFAALGVLLAFVFTILLLPLMLSVWSPVSKKRAKRFAESPKPQILQRLLLQVETLSYTYPKVLVGLFLIMGVIFLIGTFKLTVDTNSIEELKESEPLRQAYALVDRVLGGTGNFEILVDTGTPDGMKNPQVLNAIDALQYQIETNHGEDVVKTLSLVNIVKDSFRSLNEGREEMYVIPQDPHMLAQTLFLFNNANPKDRRQMVSDDYRMSRISVNTKNMGSKYGEQFMQQVQREIDAEFAALKQAYPDIALSITGQIPLNNTMASFISWSLIRSFGVTLGVISLLLLFLFGSKRIGLIAIVPNVFPILTIFGLMGYFKVPLEMHLVLVAPITIGIAVDDTIHFLTHFRLEMQRLGDVRQAIQATIKEVGQAVVFTSAILSAGFLVFMFSVTKGFIFFGLLSAIAMVAALLADLFLLPAMLTVFNGRKS